MMIEETNTIRGLLNTVRRTGTPGSVGLRRVADGSETGQTCEIYAWVDLSDEPTHQLAVFPTWPDEQPVSHIVAYAEFDFFTLPDREMFERLAGGAMERADALIENLDLYDWVVLVRAEARALCRFWEEMATRAFVEWRVYPALLRPIEEVNELDGDPL